MFTRQDYMSKKCTFSEYYSQFVSDYTKRIVLSQWTKRKLANAYEKDRHLNSLPLGQWDNLACALSAQFLRDYGDYPTLAGKVCILKESARHIVKDL